MEEIRRRGHICYLHVAVLVLAVELIWGRKDPGIFIAQLEIAFHSARRVLGSLTVVPMWKRKNETRTLQPLHLSRSNELIDDALSVVGKIAKLSLPYN